MKRMMSLVLIMVTLLSTAKFAAVASASEKANHYPIVLVHGMLGWGRDEMNGTYYWGGDNGGDIQEDLRSQGYECYTASVGPISSVWDRACELYAQLVGTTVDYGAVHSQKYGHDRYGKTYTEPLYPQWGQLDEAGRIKKIHLLSHSMGGQTARALVQLLATGSQEERAGTPAAELSPLFEGGKESWVSSVTSISTPHDGTSLLYGISGVVPLVKSAVTAIAAGTGTMGEPVYDFDWGHWGLTKSPDELWISYADRVANSRAWTTNDNCFYDNSPTGARDLNSWVKAQPGVYYFSWTTEKTHFSLVTFEHEPDIDMNFYLRPFAKIMGSYTCTSLFGKVPIDFRWFENDGVVNAISQNGPKINSTDQIIKYKGTPKIGVWNEMNKLDLDHMQIMGFGVGNTYSYFRSHAELLARLTN